MLEGKDITKPTYYESKENIEDYDKHNFETTLTEKLENPKYAEAYNLQYILSALYNHRMIYNRLYDI